MPRQKVSMEHPVSAASKRISKTKEVLDGAQDVFDKLDKEKEEKVTKQEAQRSPEKIRPLKELLFLGKLQKTVEIDGFFFTLQTLTNSESRELTKRIIRMTDEARMSEANILHVAASLQRINGQDIEHVYEEFFGEIPDTSQLELNLEILSNLNTHLVGRLIQEYFDMSDESKKLLGLTNEEEDSESESAENLNS